MDHQFQKKVWLNIGIILGSVLIFGMLSFWFAGKIKESADKASLSKASISNYNRAVAIFAELKSKESEVELYSKYLKALLPSKDDLIELPRFLEESGRVHQVNVKFNFKAGAVAEPQGKQPGSVGFTLHVAGSYDRLRNFFKEIESGSIKFMIALDSMDVNLSGNEYRATAEGRAFFK